MLQSSTAQSGQPVAPKVLGFQLGHSSLNDVLFVLRQPKAVYLAGEDQESSTPKSTDPVVLLYDKSYKLQASYHCAIRFFFNPSSYRVEVVTIDLPEGGSRGLAVATKEEIEATFGKGYRTVHRRFVIDPDGIEGELTKCDDPQGDVESLIYRDLGLEVRMGSGEKKGHALALRFSRAIWSGEEKIEPCSP